MLMTNCKQLDRQFLWSSSFSSTYKIQTQTVTTTKRKAAQNTSYRDTCKCEIDSRCQFHQRFYVRIFHTNVVLAAFSCYILALAKNLYEKGARIMLMKLTAGHKQHKGNFSMLITWVRKWNPWAWSFTSNMTSAENAFMICLWQHAFIFTFGAIMIDCLKSKVEDWDRGKCFKESGGNSHLETVVKFTNFLWGAFVPILFWQKNTNSNFK